MVLITVRMNVTKTKARDEPVYEFIKLLLEMHFHSLVFPRLNITPTLTPLQELETMEISLVEN